MCEARFVKLRLWSQAVAVTCGACAANDFRGAILVNKLAEKRGVNRCHLRSVPFSVAFNRGLSTLIVENV